MATVLSPGRFFGTVEGKHATGPFRLVETSYASGERIPAHDHASPYFCFVLQGDYRERADNREVACRRDTVVFHPGSAPHEDRFGDLGGRCFNLECESSWLDDRNSGLEALTSPVYLDDAYTAWLTRRLVHEARTLAGRSNLAIDGLARALVAAVARQAAEREADDGEPAGPDWFREAAAIASREYADRLGLADIASRVGIHPRHLARTFRDRMRCSLGEFIRRRRVEAACRLMRESRRLPVAHRVPDRICRPEPPHADVQALRRHDTYGIQETMKSASRGFKPVPLLQDVARYPGHVDA